MLTKMYGAGGGNYAQITKETITSSSSGYVVFPTNRMVINATTDTYKSICILNQMTTSGDSFYCRGRMFIDESNSSNPMGMLAGNTSYEVTYTYIDANN